MRIDVHIHTEGSMDSQKLDTIIQLLQAMKIKEEHFMSATDDALKALQAQVAQTTTIEGSAVTLIQGLAAQIAALAAQGTVDPADLAALSASLNASATSLAAAVTANTGTPPVA